MTTAETITQTLVFQVQPDVHLQDVTSKTESNNNPAIHAFIQAVKLVSSQKGLIRQYWGHQVEDPIHFLWYCDWESYSHYTTFRSSPSHDSMVASLTSTFNYTASPLATFTYWTSPHIDAFTSRVTEIAFVTLPERADRRTKLEIEKAMIPVMTGVTTVGKSTGASLGWVSEVFPSDQAAAPEGQVMALQGVFGYESIEDHMRWRETKEHAAVIEIMVELTKSRGLKGSEVGGREMFHVRFQHKP